MMQRGVGISKCLSSAYEAAFSQSGPLALITSHTLCPSLTCLCEPSNVWRNSWPILHTVSYSSCSRSTHEQLQGSRHLSTAASFAAPTAFADGHPHINLTGQGQHPLPIFTDKTSADLSASDISAYYRLQLGLIPEALPKLHQLYYAPLPGGRLRRGGNIGLQHELKLSKDAWVMYRSCVHDLWRTLQEPGHDRILLNGPTGCGKSVAVAATVEWARQHGWLVFYVPSAETLIRGGYCRRIAGREKWDTIVSAQHILKGMMEAHEQQLSQIPAHTSTKNNLLEIVREGLATDDRADVAVDACLTLRDELIAASTEHPVLFVIDDYNYLYWKTEYGVPLSKRHRRELAVDELTLASGLRLLSGPVTGSAKVLCATSLGQRIPPSLDVPTANAHTFHLPRFSEEEIANVLEYYQQIGVAPKLQSWSQVKKLLALSNGDGNIVRQYAPRVSAFNMNMI